jgi:hypothetical protein
MKKLFVVIAIILPALLLRAQDGKQRSPDPAKGHTREISPKRLPKSITTYIMFNLPDATITKATKQRKNPGGTYVVTLQLKTIRHILVFNKQGELVKLNGKRIKAATLEKQK